MDSEELLKKWLNNALSDEEKRMFDSLDDAQLNKYIIDNAQLFKASNFSEINNFEVFKIKHNQHKIPVKKLNWIYPLLKIASIIVISLGVYFTFFFNQKMQFVLNRL